MLKVVSQDTLLEARRKYTGESKIPFIFNGKLDYVNKKLLMEKWKH